MTFINKFKKLGTKSMGKGKYSLYLSEVRKNLAASANCSCVALPPTIPVGDLDRSSLMRSYGYASANDQSTLFAIFSLNFVSFMQYAG